MTPAPAPIYIEAERKQSTPTGYPLYTTSTVSHCLF